MKSSEYHRINHGKSYQFKQENKNKPKSTTFHEFEWWYSTFNKDSIKYIRIPNDMNALKWVPHFTETKTTIWKKKYTIAKRKQTNEQQSFIYVINWYGLQTNRRKKNKF